VRIGTTLPRPLARGGLLGVAQRDQRRLGLVVLASPPILLRVVFHLLAGSMSCISGRETIGHQGFCTFLQALLSAPRSSGQSSRLRVVAFPSDLAALLGSASFRSIAASRPSVLAVLRHERQRPPEPPPLRCRYHPSLWRGFSFDLETLRVIEYLGKYLERLHLFFVFLILGTARHRIEFLPPIASGAAAGDGNAQCHTRFPATRMVGPSSRSTSHGGEDHRPRREAGHARRCRKL